MTRWKCPKHLMPIGLLAALTAALTWPLASLPLNRYPSANYWWGGDPDMYIWYMDWLAKWLTGRLPVEAGQMVFWPNGISPWAGYDGPLMNLIGVPVNLLTGQPILAYNIFVLSCFLFACFAAYALAWHLTQSRYGAFFAGLIFGLSPFMMVRGAYHPNLIMIGTVPLLALAAVKFGQAPSRSRLAWLAGAVILNALSSWYYHAGAVVLLGMAAIYFWPQLNKRARLAWSAVPVLLIAGLLPALPLFFSETGGSNPADREFIRSVGMRMHHLLLPHPFMDITNETTSAIYEAADYYYGGPGVLESTSYLGLLVIGLMLLWAVRRKQIKLETGYFWVFVFFVFMTLAQGLAPEIGFLKYLVPFELLRLLPKFELVRVPNRLFVFGLMSAAVLAAAALGWLARKLKPKQLLAVTVLVSAGLIGERLMLPYPMVETEVPEFYRQVASDDRLYAIADVPHFDPGFSVYNHYQMVHGKPLVTGEFFYPAYSHRVFQLIESNPLLLMSYCKAPPYLSAKTRKQLTDPWPSLEELSRNNVKYLVVHNLLLRANEPCSPILDRLHRLLDGIEHVYADGVITVYDIETLVAEHRAGTD